MIKIAERALFIARNTCCWYEDFLDHRFDSRDLPDPKHD